MEYEFWLAGIQGVYANKKIRLRECMKTAEAIYYMEETQLRRFEFLNENDRNKIMQAQENSDFRTDYKRMCEKNIRFVPYFSGEYPERLKEIADYPYALYVKGNLPQAKTRKAAVIGARRCTPYGEKYAIDFAQALAAPDAVFITPVFAAWTEKDTLDSNDLARAVGNGARALSGSWKAMADTSWSSRCLAPTPSITPRWI